MSNIYVIKLLLLLSFFSTQSNANQIWLENDYIKKTFYKIALNNEFTTGVRPLIKWISPMNIYIDSLIGNEKMQRTLVESHTKEIASLTNLKIRFVNNPRNANINIIFTNKQQFKESLTSGKNHFPKNALCTFKLMATNKGHIIKSTIIIPVDMSRKLGNLKACVVEEFTQILGLTNDDDSVYPTIFSDRSTFKDLTPLDKTLIKLLYNPMLKPGMNWATIEPILDNILANQ